MWVQQFRCGSTGPRAPEFGLAAEMGCGLRAATNITSKCRIASIGPDDVMILRHDANPGRMKFSGRTGGDYAIIEGRRFRTQVRLRANERPFCPLADLESCAP